MNTPATPNTRTMKPPPSPAPKTPRPRDRVTDNRASFLQRLETLRSATRRSHIEEPTTGTKIVS